MAGYQQMNVNFTLPEIMWQQIKPHKSKNNKDTEQIKVPPGKEAICTKWK